MRLIIINSKGHELVQELSREQIEEMTAEQRAAEIEKIEVWIRGERDAGRLVVEVPERGADGEKVVIGQKPQLGVFQYESHEPLVGGYVMHEGQVTFLLSFLLGTITLITATILVEIGSYARIEAEANAEEAEEQAKQLLKETLSNEQLLALTTNGRILVSSRAACFAYSIDRGGYVRLVEKDLVKFPPL